MLQFKHLFICLFSFNFWIHAVSQKTETITVNFIPTFKHTPVVPEDAWYKISEGDSINFTSLKFYISAFTLYNDDSLIMQEENSFHLLDISMANGMRFKIPAPKSKAFNTIHFNLGIDSLTNVSGALDGALDPTLGMYWTWQSGYINFKLEGKSNVCKTRNNEFGFHLGGYLPPNNAVQYIVLKSATSATIDIELPLDQLIEQIDLSKQNSITIPGKEAVALSKKIASLFTLISK